MIITCKSEYHLKDPKKTITAEMIVTGKSEYHLKDPKKTITAVIIVPGKRGPMVVREACDH